MVSAFWRKVALASCRLGVGRLRQNRGCWLALQLPYPTLECRFGTKGTLYVQACLPPGVWTWEMSVIFFFFEVIYLFIYLILTALGLRCCVRGLLFLEVRGLLIAVASLVGEHGL